MKSFISSLGSMIYFIFGNAKIWEVNEVRMLRWMCGITKIDEIRNEQTRAGATTTRV